MRILLYTLIPAEREFEPFKRTPFQFLRNRARRFLDLAIWRITGIWQAHYSTFEDHHNSNRGDIAIRIGVHRQLERLFADHTIEIDEIAWGDLGLAISAARAPYDLIVIAGGGFLFADPRGRLPPRFAADVEALTRTRTPVAAVSIGLNHLIMPGAQDTRRAFAFHRDQHALIRRFIDRVELISVRDDATRAALAAVDPSCGEVIIDPAFLLVSTFDGERRRKRARGGPALAVGLNVAFHGTHATTVNRRLLREMVHALQTFAAETPTRFYYFVHSDSEHAIVDAFRLWGLSIEVVEGDVDTMLTAYKRLDIHIGQMLHSTIFAMAVGVPALAVAYDTKSAAFYELFGLGRICVDATTLDRHRLLTAMRDLVKERENVAALIYARGAALRTDAAGFYKRIADMVVGEAIPRTAARSVTRFGRSNSHPAE
ncbi:MAG: polysaccharide pyruvyl transferase family protein [Rhodospirillaceae bacterium]